MNVKLWLIFSLIFFSLLVFNSCSKRNDDFSIWIGGSPEEVDFWEKVINDFNEKYDYDLILIRQPTYTDQRKQSLIISLEGKQPNPDLFLMDVVWINQFIQSSWLELLDDFATESNFSFPGSSKKSQLETTG